MITSVLTRRIAILTTGAAVAASLLAAPAHASSTGRWDESTLIKAADRVCSEPRDRRAPPVIEAASYVPAGAVAEAVLVSARIDRDGDLSPERNATLTYETVCTFALIAPIDSPGAGYASWLDGTYRLTDHTGMNLPWTRTLPSVPYENTYPIFSYLEAPVSVTLTASGNHLQKRRGIIMVPGAPRNASQIAAAKKRYDTSVRLAKKTYSAAKKKASKLAGKSTRAKARAKAKKRYSADLRNARMQYEFRTATPGPLPSSGVVTDVTPFSLTASVTLRAAP